MNPSDLQAIAAKLPLSEATRRRNFSSGGCLPPETRGTVAPANREVIAPVTAERPPARFRQRTKPLLNRLETRLRDWLRIKIPGVDIWEQAVTFRLANGVRYTPDLALYSDMQTFCCFEAKGPWSPPTGIAKLKMAATIYPKVHWIMAWEDKAGQWQTQEARP